MSFFIEVVSRSVFRSIHSGVSSTKVTHCIFYRCQKNQPVRQGSPSRVKYFIISAYVVAFHVGHLADFCKISLSSVLSPAKQLCAPFQFVTNSLAAVKRAGADSTGSFSQNCLKNCLANPPHCIRNKSDIPFVTSKAVNRVISSGYFPSLIKSTRVNSVFWYFFAHIHYKAEICTYNLFLLQSLSPLAQLFVARSVSCFAGKEEGILIDFFEVHISNAFKRFRHLSS